MDETSNNANRGVGRGMLWLAAIGLLAGLTYMFSVLTPQRGALVQGRDAAGLATVALQQDRSGHYLAEGSINGEKVVFIVDTGATDVAVSESVARRIGLDFGPQVVVMTAAGPAKAWVTRLERVSLGALSLANVRATITPGLGDEALLGMSFLKHFTLLQEGDTLVISSGEGTGI